VSLTGHFCTGQSKEKWRKTRVEKIDVSGLGSTIRISWSGESLSQYVVERGSKSEGRESGRSG